MEIPVTIQFDEVPEGYVIVRAYPTRDRGTMDGEMVFPPPHLNPRAFDLTVPTPEPHIVIVYDSEDGIETGIIRSSFFATPKFYNGVFIPDLTIKVDGGVADVDPVSNTRTAYIPSIVDYTIARIFRSADQRFIRKDRDAEWIPRGDGGFNLIDPVPVFYPAETLVLTFQPYYDTNVGAEIYDLTQLLQDHINNTENPHEVTKSQVGLSNLPNATSNATNLDDPSVLATAKAVNDLRLSISNAIVYRGKFNVGDVVTDSLKTISHGQNISGEYLVAGSLVSVGGDWNADNDVMWMVRSLTANSFDLVLREVASQVQQLWFYYALIKL